MRKEIRLKDSTVEALAELRGTLGIANDTELIELCVVCMATIGKLKEGKKKKVSLFDLFNSIVYKVYSMYRGSDIKSIVESIEVVINSTTISKKEGLLVEIPNKKEESYQQTIFTHDRVKDAMPYGEEFGKAWINWRVYLREAFNLHPPVQSQLAQLKELNDLKDERRAIETINQSIKNNYRGLFPGKQQGRKGTSLDADKARSIINKKFGADG